MSAIKPVLRATAGLLRLIAKAVLHWPWVAAFVCVVSPISPHVRIPYELSYQPCAYLGTRGVIETDRTQCPVIAIVNTSTAEIVSW